MKSKQINLNEIDKSQLMELVEEYPEYREQLLEKAKAYGLLRLPHNGWAFYKLLELVPEEKENIKNQLLKFSHIDQIRFIKDCNDVQIVINCLGSEMREAIVTIAGQLKGGLTQLIKNTDDFDKFCNNNDTLARDIIAAQHQEGQSAFYFSTDYSCEYVRFLQLYPEHHSILKQVLLDKLVDTTKSVRNYINSLSNLAIIISHFQELQNELLALYFTAYEEHKYAHYDLSSAFNKAPQGASVIWSYIQASPKLYEKIISSPEQSFKIIKSMTMSEDSCGHAIGEQQPYKKFRLFFPALSRLKLDRFKNQLSLSRYVFNNSMANTNWLETSKPESFVPDEFHSLFSLKDEEPLLTTCTHASSASIREILRDGILYPRKASKVRGIGNQSDANRGDDELVFTSTFGKYKGDYFVFSIPLLCAINRYHNNSENVVFKFYDWSIFHQAIFKLTPEIEIRNFFGGEAHSKTLPKYSEFTFHITGKEDPVATVKIPLEKMMYYGYKGLNNYLRFFIFFIVSSLPENHHPLRDAIYAEFRSMGTKALHRHLTKLAQMLWSSSELNFLGKVSLDHFMIKSVAIDNHSTDLDTLREHIKKGEITALHQALSKESTYTLLTRSYFLTSGLVNYAEQCNEHPSALLLRRSFHTTLELENFNKRKAVISDISSEIVDEVYSLSSKPYSLAPNDRENFKEFIAYRPNHGAIHAVVKAFIVPFIIKLIRTYGIMPYREAIEEQDEHRFVSAAMYLVLGRESEAGINDDQELYLSFRKASGSLFYNAFKERDDFTPVSLVAFQDAVIALGKPENRDPIHVVLNIAHKSLLGRVFDFHHMNEEKEYIKQFFQCSVADEVANALLAYATVLLDKVGDTIRTSYCDSIHTRTARVKDIFVSLSQRENFAELIDLLAKVAQPLLPCEPLEETLMLPEVRAINNMKTGIPVEDYDYEISKTIRVSLRKIINDNQGSLQFFAKNEDKIKFAAYLLNCDDKISDTLLSTIKQRYPDWNSGYFNELIAIVATIEQQRLTAAPPCILM